MLLMGLFFSVSSCDYLAVSDQMSGGLQNTDQIFENVAYTQTMVCQCLCRNPRLFGNKQPECRSL